MTPKKGECSDVPMVDWERIRAEYIAGGISYKKLSDKYGVSLDAIKRRASKEEWNVERTKTAPKIHQETVRKTVQKAANAAADNAAIAQRIRAKLLKKLETEIDGLPDVLGSETAKEMSKIDRETGKRISEYKRWRLRDLTAAYKDLTADMDLAGEMADDNLTEYLEGMRHATPL